MTDRVDGNVEVTTDMKSPKTVKIGSEDDIKSSTEISAAHSEPGICDGSNGVSSNGSLEVSELLETNVSDVCKTDIAEPREVIDVLDDTQQSLSLSCPLPEDSAAGLSKRQVRKRKKFEKHLEQRKAKRVEEKARQKEKNRKIAEETGQTVRMKREYFKGALERSVDINIVFDLSFSELMSIKDLHKVVQQIQRCYSVNRASPKPLKIHLAGLDEKGKEAFKHSVPGYEGWQVSTITDESYADHFKMQVETKKLFYLTAESDKCMSSLELGTYYVIGGLVDHNSLKGHCHNLANEKSVPTMRLPISEHIDLKTRHVLTINHVFEILLALNNQDDESAGGWKEALTTVIPQRKGLQAKSDSLEATKNNVAEKAEEEAANDVEAPNLQ